MAKLNNVEIHFKHSNRTYNTMTAFLVLIHSTSCYYSIKTGNNTITRILAKDAILKRELHYTHDYNSDV